MFVYQIERYQLEKSIAKYAYYLYGKMLDIGSCGLKSRYFKLFKNIQDYVSLDIDPKYNPDIIGNAESMSMISDNSFDSIFCGHVLCYVPHPEKAIKEFFRVLRGGGTLLLTMPFINLYHGDSDYWRFSPNGVKLLLSENGFEVLELENVTVGIFSVMNQFLNRFIKINLSLDKKNFLRRIFNKIFCVSGRLSIILDKLFKSNTNNQFFLNVLVVAKKPN